MKELEREAQVNGALISYHSEVTSIQKSPDGYVIEINKEDKLLAERVINAAGLFSDKIAALAGIDIAATHYQLHLCKGEYFSYSKPSFLKHLIYPVTEQDVKDLGIHAVLDLAGGLKFGPNAEYVENIDYQVNPQHKSLFYKAINTLFPQIKEEDLSPDQAGIRPKLQGEGEGFRDFIIKEESDIGFPGLINLIGVESPGLTACLAIARHTSKLID
jgi:L-2-hydroxyglutarate oxidase LhgO